MLTRLHIRNYRGIRDLVLESLGRLTLLVGENGSGKTSVLEAIALLGSAGRPGAVAPIAGTRGPEARGVSEAETLRDLIWLPMFRGLDATSPIVLSAQDGVDSTSLEIRMEAVEETTISEIRRESPFVAAVEEALFFKYKRGDDVFESRALLGADERMHAQQPRDLPAPKFTFLPPGSGLASQDAMKLGALRHEKRSDFLRDALSGLDSRIRSVEENSSSGAPAIYCDVEGLPRLMSLSSLGAGLANVARYLIAIASRPGSVVLIDEIENGLHHTALVTAWKAIRSVAERSDAQVFATTHSWECIRAARDALGAEEIHLARIEREDGVVRAVEYSDESLGAALEFGMEMR